MRQIKTVKRNGTVSREKVRAAVIAVRRQSHLEERILCLANKNSDGYLYEHATFQEISEALTALVRDGCLEIVFLPQNSARSADIHLKLTPSGKRKEKEIRKREAFFEKESQQKVRNSKAK